MATKTKNSSLKKINGNNPGTLVKSPIKPIGTPVNHPDHYNNSPSGIECIDVVEHMSFNVGNAIKYLWRHGDKGNAIQDLQKAIWYSEREIEGLKSMGK